MRLFYALELADEARQALAALRPGDPAMERAYRWVEPNLLHVTLIFLGNQPESSLSELILAGEAAARYARPGVLRLGHIGTFGGARTPRVVWAGVEGDVSALENVHRQLATSLRGVVESERGPFRPHITLARRRPSAPVSIQAPWPSVPPVPQLSIPMQDFVLMESQLSASGPTYTPLHRFTLGG